MSGIIILPRITECPDLTDPNVTVWVGSMGHFRLTYERGTVVLAGTTCGVEGKMYSCSDEEVIPMYHKALEQFALRAGELPPMD